MIIQLLQLIKQEIKDIPALRMIDFDRGQMNNPQRFESIIQPAVLVGIPRINWEEKSKGQQDGDMLFYTKTIVRLPQHQQFYTKAEYEHSIVLDQESMTMIEIEDEIHQKISNIPGVFRTATSFDFIDTFFQVQHTYTLPVEYTLINRYQDFLPSNNPGIHLILEK